MALVRWLLEDLIITDTSKENVFELQENYPCCSREFTESEDKYMSCTIRKATPWDLPRIREIYEVARQFMRKNGNHSQWGKGDEPEALIEGDICQGNLYVLEEADIHAVFAFIIGEDPTYLEIEEGNWK